MAFPIPDLAMLIMLRPNFGMPKKLVLPQTLLLAFLDTGTVGTLHLALHSSNRLGAFAERNLTKFLG